MDGCTLYLWLLFPEEDLYLTSSCTEGGKHRNTNVSLYMLITVCIYWGFASKGSYKD